MQALLYVQTASILLEIRGPTISQWGTIGTRSLESGRLDLTATDGIREASWLSASGEERAWPADPEGPVLFEETGYRLRAKSLVAGNCPLLVTRDPTLFQDVDQYADEGFCAGPFSFRGQVGRVRFEVRLGNETLTVGLQIFPAKLSYETDYQALLYEVTSAAKGLGLEYLRSTFQSAGTEQTDTSSSLEWIVLLRNEIVVLDQAIRYVAAHPHRTLSLHHERTRVDKVHTVYPQIVRFLSSGRGNGSAIDVPRLGRIKEFVSTPLRIETLDTPELRWLWFNLRLIGDRLAGIYSTLASEQRQYLATQTSVPKRLIRELSELEQFIATVKQLVDLPVFGDAYQAPPPGFSSLTLLMRAGYADAYRAIWVLRLGLDISGDPLDVSVMDVQQLYETWCYIAVLKIVAVITGSTGDVGSLIRVEENGIRVTVSRGKKSKSSFPGLAQGGFIDVTYNEQYPGLTGGQKPDIVIHLRHQGWPDLIVVLDAKYRLDASPEYRRAFGIPGPPQEAINALHRYRDAIVLETAQEGRHRPTVKGAALFPLALDESLDFDSSRLRNALDVLGIGALPFLPSNTAFVENWLASLLQLPPEELAEPGPPFSGLRAKNAKASIQSDNVSPTQG